jgi:hypothetical protein
MFGWQMADGSSVLGGCNYANCHLPSARTAILYVQKSAITSKILQKCRTFAHGNNEMRFAAWAGNKKFPARGQLFPGQRQKRTPFGDK